MIDKKKINSFLAKKAKNGSLCIYGSYYKGLWEKNRSDIDVIIFQKGKGIRKHKQFNYLDVEINIVYLSIDVLTADAEKNKYGFLYISKFLNPHFFLADHLGAQELIPALCAKYLDSYAIPDIFSQCESLNLNQIIARIYLLHINNFPHYIVKLTNTFQAGDFRLLEKQFLAYLRESAMISIKNENFILNVKLKETYRPYFHEQIRLYWWQTFQNYRKRNNFLCTQIDKPKETIEKQQINLQKIYDFLKQEAS